MYQRPACLKGVAGQGMHRLRDEQFTVLLLVEASGTHCGGSGMHRSCSLLLVFLNKPGSYERTGASVQVHMHVKLSFQQGARQGRRELSAAACQFLDDL